jgi:hypothetical protein
MMLMAVWVDGGHRRDIPRSSHDPQEDPNPDVLANKLGIPQLIIVHRPSRGSTVEQVELHPKWVTSAKVASCSSSSNYGAHQYTTTPEPCVAASPSKDATTAVSVLRGRSYSSLCRAVPSPVIKRWLFSRSTVATSLACSAQRDDVVRNELYNTDNGCDWIS